MATNVKPPTTFWVIAVFAILWNIIEIYFSSFEIDFLQQNSTNEEFEKIQSLPLWYVVIFIVALFSEMLGSFMLFMRQKLAIEFFAISLIGLLFVEIYWLFIINLEEISILFSIIIPTVVIAIATFLYFYSKRARTKGWLK